MILPKICSIEEENSRVDSSMGHFGEISDASSSSEQQDQSNPTIISKLRKKFSMNNKQNQIFKDNSSAFSTSDPLLIQPFQGSTPENQIFLSTEEINTDISIANM